MGERTHTFGVRRVVSKKKDHSSRRGMNEDEKSWMWESGQNEARKIGLGLERQEKETPELSSNLRHRSFKGVFLSLQRPF